MSITVQAAIVEDKDIFYNKSDLLKSKKTVIILILLLCIHIGTNLLCQKGDKLFTIFVEFYLKPLPMLWPFRDLTLIS